MMNNIFPANAGAQYNLSELVSQMKHFLLIIQEEKPISWQESFSGYLIISWSRAECY